MAIATPRGLLVRLPTNYAFALMARLYPRKKPFEVLKTVEGITCIPGFLTFVATVITFGLRLDPWLCVGIILFVRVIGTFMVMNGFFAIPGLVELSTLYSSLESFGLYSVIMIVTAYISIGFWSLLVVPAVLIGGSIIGNAIEFVIQQSRSSTLGIYLSPPEFQFINAYKMHATELGITTDVVVDDAEMYEDNWKPTYNDLATNWPMVVRRFTPESHIEFQMRLSGALSRPSELPES